ncbi:MAG: hypothetical protein IPJ04_03395 [Candidatus Eisenbacteria bacterium]|nr:hypothetical protein [Candidatus Eisenbacteria bacterium]
MNRPLRAAALATALSLIVHVPADAQSWQRSGSRYSQSHASADTVGRRPATGLEDAIEFSGWRVPLVRIVNLIDGLGRELQEPGLYELAIRTVDDLAGPRHPFAGYLHVRLSYRYWMAGETARAFDHAVLGEDILREHLYLRLRSLSDAESGGSRGFARPRWTSSSRSRHSRTVAPRAAVRGMPSSGRARSCSTKWPPGSARSTRAVTRRFVD